MGKLKERKIALTPEELRALELQARIRMKALVRQALVNADWLCAREDEVEMGGNVRRNVAVLLRKKTLAADQSLLSLEEKRTMRKPSNKRTDEEKQKLIRILGNLKCFRRYPKKVSRSLASSAYYMYLPKGKVLVKENDMPQSLYFILQGSIKLTQKKWDYFDEAYFAEDFGTSKSGDLIGEFAMLYSVPRMQTCVALENCELLSIHKKDFDSILNEMLATKWDQIQRAISCFTYFKDLDEVSLRECCILAKIRSYEPMKTIYGDGKGTKHVVYFLLSGTCRLIERLQVEVTKVGKKEFYKRYEPTEEEIKHAQEMQEEFEPQKRLSIGEQLARHFKTQRIICGCTNFLQTGEMDDGFRRAFQVRNRRSMFLEIEEFKRDEQAEIADEKEINVEEITYNYGSADLEYQEPPEKDIRTVFMQLAVMSRGSVFALGEYMKNRAVVSKDPVVVLLIPRYWLAQHHSQCWGRIMHFLDRYIPSSDAVFKEFVAGRKWRNEKHAYRNKLIESSRKPLSTSINEVPYSIRMDEDLDFTFADTQKYTQMWDNVSTRARKVTSREGYRPRRKDL
ncbi:uncharacterized protein LOC113389594 [Ctenocephalides felis]|uniref:uncharacterized protein LOC113389594 n=1 Tax=Ctenocephalides felis TaxID=7515 RepID=UPI000E6E48C8|nr:uncharacterized protein LOC113389594 [Ctenocephalides felis]